MKIVYTLPRFTVQPLGATVVLPIVTQSETNSYVPSLGFAAFQIDASVGERQVHHGALRGRLWGVSDGQ